MLNLKTYSTNNVYKCYSLCRYIQTIIYANAHFTNVSKQLHNSMLDLKTYSMNYIYKCYCIQTIAQFTNVFIKLHIHIITLEMYWKVP